MRKRRPAERREGWSGLGHSTNKSKEPKLGKRAEFKFSMVGEQQGEQGQATQGPVKATGKEGVSRAPKKPWTVAQGPMWEARMLGGSPKLGLGAGRLWRVPVRKGEGGHWSRGLWRGVASQG